MRTISALLPALLLFAATGCLVRGPRGRVAVMAPVPVIHVGFAHREPPPVRSERIPPPPGADHVWVAGRWAWEAEAYVWRSGYYHRRPRHGAAWVDGHWKRHDRGWQWVDGHWR